MKKLYLDLDGVIINTNKFAQEEITKSGIDITQKNSLIELCKTFPWRCFLDNCETINNSFEIVPKLSLKYDVTIITHCYSSLEADLKQNFIKNKFQNIKCITVPFKKRKTR